MGRSNDYSQQEIWHRSHQKMEKSGLGLMNDIVENKPNQLVDPQAQIIVEYLESAGLPSDNIIANLDQRKVIGDILPGFINQLPEEIKTDATYLSKFVVGAGCGLFDYSLNAIFNEVVVDLRKKAISYGLDIFFDAAVGGGKNRDMYSTETDLENFKDIVLLDTCRKLELISDPTYTKLKHILDMRNNVGISHPNSYNIDAYELMGWLSTCVQGVLKDRPTEAALRVKEFIRNLKRQTTPLDKSRIKIIDKHINELPTHFCGNILRTIFGIFVAPDTSSIVRKNISIIAPFVWNVCLDESRYKLGVVLEGYNANLHTAKYELGEGFFNVVGGNAYRSKSERLIIVNDLLSDLKNKHHDWNNFYHEVPIARSLVNYIPNASFIIPNFAEPLFRTVLLCRIGNGVKYNNGVSPGARRHYEQILSYAGDQYALIVMNQLDHFEIRGRLNKETCRRQSKLALEAVKPNVINSRLNECIDYLIANIEGNANCVADEIFKRLSAGCANGF